MRRMKGFLIAKNNQKDSDIAMEAFADDMIMASQCKRDAADRSGGI